MHGSKKDGRRGVDLPQRYVPSTISFGLAPLKTPPEKRQSCMALCAVFMTEVVWGTVQCLWIFFCLFFSLSHWFAQKFWTRNKASPPLLVNKGAV